MMIMSPIWGALGDRYGRKMMLVRATLSGAFVLYLMGVVKNIEALIVLRMLQGAFTGTVPAAQTLAVTSSPENRQGFAIGFLMAAVNAGIMSGFFFGGICAMHYGAVTTFKVAGFMLLVATVLVLTIVKEDFVRPERLPRPTPSVRLRRRREMVTNIKSGIPILLTVAFIAFIQTWDGPYLSLYVDSLYRAGLDSARVITDEEITSNVYGIVGSLGAIASLVAMVGSIALGSITDRKLPRWIWGLISAMSALGLFLISRYQSITGLIIGRSVFLFFINGLASVVIVVLARMTPSSKRGAALGWSTTARSVGWAVAPMLGAHFAESVGFGPAYLVLSVICLLLVPAFLILDRRYESAFHPMDEDPPSLSEVGKDSISTPSGQGRIG